MDRLLLLAAAVALVWLALKLLARPHTVVEVGEGRARLVRGRPPPGLLGELDDVASHAPHATGRVTLTGGGDRLILRTPGLDSGLAQRVRNVVFLYRDRIR
ncbi:MAG: DUF3634 family protein [Myxococcota bacterium]